MKLGELLDLLSNYDRDQEVVLAAPIFDHNGEFDNFTIHNIMNVAAMEDTKIICISPDYRELD